MPASPALPSDKPLVSDAFRSYSSTAPYPRRVLEYLDTIMPITEKEKVILADERPHLIVLRGPSLGDFFALEGDNLVLGSDPFRADLVVRDVEVSQIGRAHV